jgi:hypothetical protein
MKIVEELKMRDFSPFAILSVSPFFIISSPRRYLPAFKMVAEASRSCDFV